MPETPPKSPKELFTARENDKDEESDDQVLIDIGERQYIFEALKQPIMPG